jgi:hypothetical protein
MARLFVKHCQSSVCPLCSSSEVYGVDVDVWLQDKVLLILKEKFKFVQFRKEKRENFALNLKVTCEQLFTHMASFEWLSIHYV